MGGRKGGDGRKGGEKGGREKTKKGVSEGGEKGARREGGRWKSTPSPHSNGLSPLITSFVVFTACR